MKKFIPLICIITFLMTSMSCMTVVATDSVSMTVKLNRYDYSQQNDVVLMYVDVILDFPTLTKLTNSGSPFDRNLNGKMIQTFSWGIKYDRGKLVYKDKLSTGNSVSSLNERKSDGTVISIYTGGTDPYNWYSGSDLKWTLCFEVLDNDYIPRLEVTHDTAICVATYINAKNTSSYTTVCYLPYKYTGDSNWNYLSVNSKFIKSYNQTMGIVSVQSVTLNASNLTLKVGDVKKLYANCYPSNASDKSVTWSTTNSSVATIDSNGYIKAVGIGTAGIVVRGSSGKADSCIITVYDSSIIDYDNYKYDFDNSKDSFGYGQFYRIPKERYIQAGFSESEARKMVTWWGGNCFGMSASSILFYMNILKEERYNSNVSVPVEFDNPDAGDGAFLGDKWEVKLRHMIELFQAYGRCDSSHEFSNASVQVMIKELDLGRPVIMRIDGIKGMHEIVIYGYRKEGINYKFYIYDCSNFVTALNYVNEDAWKFDYVKESYFTKCAWIPMVIRPYNAILDIYRDLYDNGSNSTSLFSSESKQSYTHIFRYAEDLTITNSYGQTSVVSNGTVSGEIPNINVTPSSYLAEVQTYTIIAPTDTYEIKGNNDEVITTSFANDYMSVDVTAKSSTPITVSSDLKEIHIDATPGDEYSVNYTTYDNIFDEMTLSGTASGPATFKLADSNVSVSGVDTLNVSASVSDSIVSTSAEDLSDNEEITVTCEENDSGATIQILSESEELTEKATLPERLTADAPVCNLESGSYEEAQILTFEDDDETIIYYTTDGSIPSADNGIIYSLPIDINKSMTIKAISTKYGYSDSGVIELNYTLPEVVTPMANVDSGEYDKVISVELSAENYDDTIYYTLDGSDPVENGILYTVPINISEDTLLRAYTLRNGCISEISEYEYTITHSLPLYFSNSLTNQDGDIINADNISDISKIRLTVSNFASDEQNGTFLIAFYDSDNKLIYVNYKAETIIGNSAEVEIDVTADVTSACTIKAFVFGDISCVNPICEVLEEKIIIQ